MVEIYLYGGLKFGRGRRAGRLRSGIDHRHSKTAMAVVEQNADCAVILDCDQVRGTVLIDIRGESSNDGVRIGNTEAVKGSWTRAR